MTAQVDVLAELVRVLEAPRGTARVDAERFREIIIGIIKQIEANKCS